MRHPLDKTYIKTRNGKEISEIVEIFKKAFPKKKEGHSFDSKDYETRLPETWDWNRGAMGKSVFVVFLQDGNIEWGVIQENYEKQHFNRLPGNWRTEWFEDIKHPENKTWRVDFTNFHTAEISRRGVKFPWREAVFPLEIVKDLIAAKKKIRA